jgi:hypothetical protein
MARMDGEDGWLEDGWLEDGWLEDGWLDDGSLYFMVAMSYLVLRMRH